MTLVYSLLNGLKDYKMTAHTNRKIYWINTAKKYSLAARMHVISSDNEKNFVTGLSEYDIDPIQTWCEKNNCGTRTSFDTFQFRNKKEITIFLLKWG